MGQRYILGLKYQKKFLDWVDLCRVQNKKYFDGYLNSDDAFEFVGKNEYINCENLRYGTTDTGVIGVLEYIGATAAVIDVAGKNAGFNTCIGGCEDEARGRLLYFVHNSNGNHGIYIYDPNAITKTNQVIISARVIGGLNFDKYHRIDRNCKVIGDLLYWTDNLNGPRKVNIEAGILTNDFTYVTPVPKYNLDGNTQMPGSILSLIKRPPIYPLNAAKAADAGFLNNFISDKAYQFTYRYRYRDSEVSALAAYSRLMPMNYVAETPSVNSINISMPLIEQIDDDIYVVDVCVKFGNTGDTFIIKSYDKDKDSGTIAAHNAGTAAIAFVFYDDVAGIALDSISSITSFDDVPLIAQTLEVARNRLFLGNNKLGYSTPATTSLTAANGSYDTAGAGTKTAHWKYFTLTYADNITGATNTVTYYYAYVSTIIPTSYYYIAQTSSTPPPSLNSVDATVNWDTEAGLANVIQRNNPPPSGNHWVYGPYVFNDTGATLNLIFTVNLNGLEFFKSGSTYKVSIAFYDQYRRKCGIVAKDVTVTTPLRTATQSVFSGNIGWTLTNSGTPSILQAEIPDWAYYYQIHISKNRTTRNFVQYNIANTAYVTKPLTPTTTLYTYATASTAFAINTFFGCGFNLTPLTSSGMGYTFSEGDLVRVYKGDGTSVLLPVLATEGSYVITAPADLGTNLGNGFPFIIEIYTPFKPADTEGLFETGPVYTILNPTAGNRSYQTLSGSINGDCYAIERDKGGSTLYFVEAMSPNDKKWTDWETDTGFVNIIDTIGQKLKTSNVMFSDTFINGTKINGLNKFQPLNNEDLGSDAGALQKLQLTSKRQEDGTVMLAICKKKTLSIYLGESQLVGTTGNAFVAKSDGVIGTINTLKGDYGTSHPESVVELRGDVYWYAIDSKAFVQYSINGIDNISNNKLRRFSNLLSHDFKAVGQTGIEAFGSQPYIIGGVDPYHKEVLWTIPKLYDTAPKGNLPDYVAAFTGQCNGSSVTNINDVSETWTTNKWAGYTVVFNSGTGAGQISTVVSNTAQDLTLSPAVAIAPDFTTHYSLFLQPPIAYPYDFYDGAGKTIVYKIEAARWQGAYVFETQMFGVIGSELFSASAGLINQHNQAGYSSFYGIARQPKFAFAENTQPSNVKVFTGISIESNAIPSFTHFRSEYPYEQSSDLVATDYSPDEGIFYSPIMRDRLTPGGVGSFEEIQVVGDRIRNVVLLCLLQFEAGIPVRVKFVSLKWKESLGNETPS